MPGARLRRGATLEPCDTTACIQPSLRDGEGTWDVLPWAEAHGYRQRLAPRGPSEAQHPPIKTRGNPPISAQPKSLLFCNVKLAKWPDQPTLSDSIIESL